MNLNKAPTVEQLQKVLQASDAAAGTHILWVDHVGEVRLAMLLSQTPAEWMKSMNGKIKFRYEAEWKDYGYVGGSATDDRLYMVTLLEKLIKDWQNDGSTRNG